MRESHPPGANEMEKVLAGAKYRVVGILTGGANFTPLDPNGRMPPNCKKVFSTGILYHFAWGQICSIYRVVPNYYTLWKPYKSIYPEPKPFQRVPNINISIQNQRVQYTFPKGSCTDPRPRGPLQTCIYHHWPPLPSIRVSEQNSRKW